jgi:NTE family protein
MSELPDDVEAHVLPTGGASSRDDSILAYRSFGSIRQRIDTAYAASAAYLAENL